MFVCCCKGHQTMGCAYNDVCVICWPFMCTPSCSSGKVICKWSSVIVFHVEAVNSVSWLTCTTPVILYRRGGRVRRDWCTVLWNKWLAVMDITCVLCFTHSHSLYSKPLPLTHPHMHKLYLKRKQGQLHKETSSCSLPALTGGYIGIPEIGLY